MNDRKYIIRDEGILPIIPIFGQYCDINKMMLAQKLFRFRFKSLISKYLPDDVEVCFDDLEYQVNKAKKDLEDKNTISLDPFYRGTHNLRVSRVYDYDSEQSNFIDLVSSQEGVSIKEQIDCIPAGNYVLVEDDSVAKDTVVDMINSLKIGETLQSKVRRHIYYETNSLLKIIGELRDDIIVNDIYLLSHYNAYDTVDLRDFMFGVSNSGLKVKLGDDTLCRVPYCSPFVSLKQRACIPKEYELEFSKKLCEINKEFICSLVPNIKLCEVSQDFMHVMCNEFSQNPMTNMIDICNFILDYLDKYM